MADLDFSTQFAGTRQRRQTYLSYSLETEGQPVGGGTVSFAKNVELDLMNADGKFSDNYFDISYGSKSIIQWSQDGRPPE